MPRTGAICCNEIHWVAATPRVRLTPTPTAATASGRPASSSEPSMTSSTTPATATPISSPMPPTSRLIVSSWP